MYDTISYTTCYEPNSREMAFRNEEDGDRQDSGSPLEDTRISAKWQAQDASCSSTRPMVPTMVSIWSKRLNVVGKKNVLKVQVRRQNGV